MIASLLFLACAVDAPDDTPACISDLADDLASADPRNPPSSITEYTVDGERYYYIPSYCCDAESELLDEACSVVCNPDGGLDGNGSGTCPDYTSGSSRVIWEDDR